MKAWLGVMAGLLASVAWAEGGALVVQSPAFQEGRRIPVKHTCDDLDISPALRWSRVPEGVLSFALIMDDPDAPRGTWDHWVLFNIPGDVRELEPRLPPRKELKDGALHGKNSWRKLGYGGPCPPKGNAHRYFFKVYALKEKLDLPPGSSKADVELAMEGRVLAQGALMGKYRRRTEK